MSDFKIWCTRSVDGPKFCPYCSGRCVKNGRKEGIQRLLCRSCNRTFMDEYRNKACYPETNKQISTLLKEGCGMRSISRILGVSVTTVLRRIVHIAKKLAPLPLEFYKCYEVDELQTFVQKKEREQWIAYSYCRDTGSVAGFAIGARTKELLKPVIDKLLLSNAQKIFTDKLPHYRSLIPKPIHKTRFRATNHIERSHLNLRTHLKRLNRKTICFSRSVTMLSACLKIYFWG